MTVFKASQYTSACKIEKTLVVLYLAVGLFVVVPMKLEQHTASLIRRIIWYQNY